MFTRKYPTPRRNFFLFGPRGTGKTTWLKQVLPGARWFNLLSTQEFLKLTRQPELFRQEVEALPAQSWVVLDEIQRLPSILNEVHSLIADHAQKYRFALTGSSARKLKRTGVNLLAGRAIQRSFFPLTGAEMNYDFSVEDLLRYGCLPQIRQELSAGGSRRDAEETLEAYVDTYLRQEIKEEALVKKLEPFSRFLEVAALANAQVTNLANLARDAGVSRPTVQGYFEVLNDTLIGSFLPAWRPKVKIKETAHPKFYFFDTGVARALSGRLREPLESQERGHLLETLIYHELRTWNHLHDLGGQLSTWRTPSGTEVDFVFTLGKRAIGIEVKSASRWRAEDSYALQSLMDAQVTRKSYGVYLGDKTLKDDAIWIFPVKEFMKRLEKGEIFE